MTTEAAARLYEAQHLYAMEGKQEVTYNPHSKPLEELPRILCFNNGGSRDWYHAVAIAEDGTCLGQHVCSSEGYMKHDLGVLEGTRLDRHEESYSKHYPDGYVMEWVPSNEIRTNEKLMKAFDLNKLKHQEAEGSKSC